MSNHCSTCQRFVDTKVLSIQLVEILIFNFQNVGQGQKLKRRQIRRWMAVYGRQDVKKWLI